MLLYLYNTEIYTVSYSMGQNFHFFKGNIPAFYSFFSLLINQVGIFLDFLVAFLIWDSYSA